MADKKRSFVMYNDYLQHFEMLTKSEQSDLIMLILRYVNGMDTGLGELSGGVKMAFSFIRRRLDDDFEKYEEVCKKRAKASKLGNEAKALKRSQMIPNGSDNENENENENVSDSVSENVSDSVNESVSENEIVKESENVVVVVGEGEAQPIRSAEARRETTTTTTEGEKSLFFPPTEEQVRVYCAERNNTIDPKRFVDYYSTNGWKVGKNPMKDWKAAVRVWEAHEKNTSARAAPLSKPSYDLDEIKEHTLSKYRDL